MRKPALLALTPAMKKLIAAKIGEFVWMQSAPSAKLPRPSAITIFVICIPFSLHYWEGLRGGYLDKSAINL